jgi:hypothetical protein
MAASDKLVQSAWTESQNALEPLIRELGQAESELRAAIESSMWESLRGTAKAISEKLDSANFLQTKLLKLERLDGLLPAGLKAGRHSLHETIAGWNDGLRKMTKALIPHLTRAADLISMLLDDDLADLAEGVTGCEIKALAELRDLMEKAKKSAEEIWSRN